MSLLIQITIHQSPSLKNWSKDSGGGADVSKLPTTKAETDNPAAG